MREGEDAYKAIVDEARKRKADTIVLGSHGRTGRSARRFLLRMCANLHQVYTQRGLTEESTRLQRYLVALAR